MTKAFQMKMKKEMMFLLPLRAGMKSFKNNFLLLKLWQGMSNSRTPMEYFLLSNKSIMKKTFLDK